MAKHVKYLDLGRDRTGRRIRKKVTANSIAELDNKVYKIKREYELYADPSNISFGQYAEKWFELEKSSKEIATQDMYRNILKKFDSIEFIRVKDIKKSHLQQIVNANYDKPRTCQQIEQTLNQIMNMAVYEGIIRINPIGTGLSLPNKQKAVKRALTEAEQRAVMSAELPQMEHLALMFFYYLGLRPEELRALMPMDIKGSELHITKALVFKNNRPILKNTKNSKSRIMEIPSFLLPEVRNYLNDSKDLYLFHGTSNTIFTQSSWYKFVRRIFRAVNRAMGGDDHFFMTDMTCYTLRHNFITRFLLYNGVRTGHITLKKASYLAGNSQNVMLEHYAHIIEENENVSAIYKEAKSCQKVANLQKT